MKIKLPGKVNSNPFTSAINIFIAWAILLITLTLTALYTYKTKQVVEEDARKDFSFECTEVMASVQTRLHAQAQMLRTAAAFFEESDSVYRNEWESFIKYQKIEKNLPEVQGVGFVSIVHASNLREHEMQIRKAGFSYYRVRPAGKREIYTPIIYLEPFNDKYLRSPGYDMFSEPILRDAMEKSRDSNIEALSDKVQLEDENYTNSKPGLLIFVPVYTPGKPLNTMEERCNAIKGWVYSPFNMDDFMLGIEIYHQKALNAKIGIQIYDDDNLVPEKLLFDNKAISKSQYTAFQILSINSTIDFNRKHLSLHFSKVMELSSFYMHKNVLLVMAGGTMISLLIFLLTLSLLKNRSRLKQSTLLADDLKKSKERYQTLVENVNDAIIVSLSNSVAYANQKFLEVFGYAEEDVLSGDYLRFIHHDDRDELLKRYLKLFEGIPLRKYQARVITREGSIKWAEFSGIAIEWDEKAAVLSFITDITESKKTEDALRISEELYKSTIKASPDVIIDTDLNGNILMVSPAALPFIGLDSADEAIGHHILEFIVPADREKAISNIDLLNRGKGLGPEAYRCQRKDGSIVDGEINGEIIHDASGEPKGFVFILRDITERKRAEKTLRESEEKWRSLVNSSPDSIALHDKAGMYLFLNHYAEGYSEKDILGHSIYEFLAPETKELFKSKYEECISIWKPVKFEHIALGNLGEMRIYEESFVPILTKNEEVNILAVAKDITEQKVAEHKIREREEHFRLIFEDGSIAMALMDDDLRFTQVNKAFVTLLGYSEAELVDMAYTKITDPEFVMQDIQQIRLLLNREIALYRTERKYVTRFKKAVWGLVQVNVMHNNAGEFSTLLITINNITERKRAEESLLESQEIFNQFMLNSPIYVFFKDKQIRSLRLSRNFEQMLGRPLNELLGKSMDEIFPSEFAKKMVADDLRILKEGKLIEIEEELNGRIYSTTKFPIYIDRKPTYLAGYTMDITSRKLADDTIKAALKEKEILLREVHHRVKNNLQVVSSLLNLQAGKISDKGFRETLEQSRNRIRSIALVHEKLYQTGNFAEINLKEYSRSLVTELFRVYLADPQKIQIRAEIEDVNIPLMYAIPCGLILNEIISNSLKYAFPKDRVSKVKPEIFIQLKTLPDNNLQLSAGDNGIGLPADYQLTGSSSLGLYLIHILSTEQLDGKIEIDNKKGTIFTITFNPYTR